MRPEGKISVERRNLTLFAQLAQSFSEVIGHQTEVVGEEPLLELGRLPPRQVEVQAIEKGPVFADDVWSRRKQMGTSWSLTPARCAACAV